MIPEKINISYNQKQYVLRRFEKGDIHRIFMAWNNPQNYRYNSIDWNEEAVEEILNYSWPNDRGMYIMVLEDKTTNQIVATCRFGTPEITEQQEWDFGYSTFRSDDKPFYTLEEIREVFIKGVKKDDSWGRGYSSIMLGTIIKLAQTEGVYRIISGADGLNFGSQKVMMKNGMSFYELEDDGDVDFILKLKDENGNSLQLSKPTKEEIEQSWNLHIKMVEKALSTKRMCKKREESEKNHYGDALLFLLLNRASRILSEETQSLEQLSILKKDIFSIYSKFTINKLGYNEKELFFKRFNAFKNRWQARIGNLSFSQANVEYNLKCCEIVENEITEKQKEKSC